jgi:hypothetical protein
MIYAAKPLYSCIKMKNSPSKNKIYLAVALLSIILGIIFFTIATMLQFSLYPITSFVLYLYGIASFGSFVVFTLIYLSNKKCCEAPDIKSSIHNSWKEPSLINENNWYKFSTPISFVIVAFSFWTIISLLAFSENALLVHLVVILGIISFVVFTISGTTWLEKSDFHLHSTPSSFSSSTPSSSNRPRLSSSSSSRPSNSRNLQNAYFAYSAVQRQKLHQELHEIKENIENLEDSGDDSFSDFM